MDPLLDVGSLDSAQMQKTIVTNTTKDGVRVPGLSKLPSMQGPGASSGYGPAQSNFQYTILSDMEMFSNKDE